MSKEPTQGRAWVAAGGLLLVGFALVELSAVLTPVFFAFMLAYMLDPLVDRLEARGLPRSAGIVVLLAASLIGLGLFCLLLLPAIAGDTQALFHRLPTAATRLLERLEPHGIAIPSSLDAMLHSLDADPAELAHKALSPARAALSWILGETAGLLSTAVAALMVPVMSFYLLEAFDRIVAQVGQLIPPRIRPVVYPMVRDVDRVLGQFLRGQLTVMVLLAGLYSVAYSLAGVPLAVPIAVTAGALSFIPYVGGGAALGLALIMSLLEFSGWPQLMVVVGVYAVIQVLEGFVLTPRIVGDKLGLSPAWVLFALTAFGQLFGFLGVMLALPAAAVIKVFVGHGVAHYRNSQLYVGPDTPRQQVRRPRRSLSRRLPRRSQRRANGPPQRSPSS